MFRTRMFPGGVHPREGINGKGATAVMPIEVLDAPSRVVIPMSQHIGAPAECIVQKGDYVLMGQLIAKGDGVVSAPVHASVSGCVVSVTQCLLPSGQQVQAVVIDNDFKDTVAPLPVPPNLDNLSKEELVSFVRDAGIVGLGGAMFPTAVKLSPRDADAIDTLVVNGAECEPYLSADHRLMLEKSSQIIDGITLVMKALKIKQAIIGVEENKKDAISALQNAISSTDIKVQSLPVSYPQGGEKQLIYALTKKRVPNGALPFAVGVFVLNVGTLFAISEALRLGRPLIERVVSVGGLVEKPGNFLVRIGTPVETLLDGAGGIKKGIKQLVYGGPMMGYAISRMDIPIIKGCSGIVALENPSQERYESACIRCGRCIRACPMQLIPVLIDQAMRVQDFASAKKAGALNCIECGACSYVCPAKRSLTQSCRVSKKKINEMAKQEQEKQNQQEKEA